MPRYKLSVNLTPQQDTASIILQCYKMVGINLVRVILFNFYALETAQKMLKSIQIH